jgi:hypothetical protein
MSDVPMLHVPNKKDLIKKALEDTDFMVNTKRDPGVFLLSMLNTITDKCQTHMSLHPVKGEKNE